MARLFFCFFQQDVETMQDAACELKGDARKFAGLNLILKMSSEPEFTVNRAAEHVGFVEFLLSEALVKKINNLTQANTKLEEDKDAVNSKAKEQVDKMAHEVTLLKETIQELKQEIKVRAHAILNDYFPPFPTYNFSGFTHVKLNSFLKWI